MRLHRTLVAGVLALGVAACGDDVQVVEPTPPQPPPPPPLAASMAPASAEVMVGSSVVFAVNASGGVAGEAASWSCASSNTGIATVSVTSAGCQATGVAAGGVTITATVSKGSETANVGSQLTVTAPPAPPPFEASIAPLSQSVAVGSSVVFAVNTSGGYTGMMGMDGMMMAASWTCASSDPAIATVEVTDAGCQATGVSGGEVTINVAATDDHDTKNLVAQLTVTTDPVVAFSAMMSPASAEVAIESSVVFAINVSGGAADATASWDCSSSDDAIATATTTDAGCEATGVAAGGVTINAAVRKGSDSANLASRLTVTAPDVGAPAFVLIASITDADGDNATNEAVNGTVTVSINVERGDQNLAGLSLMVDDEVVAQQSFGMAAVPALDEPAEQVGVHTFKLSFDSADHDTETGAVTYPNGDYTISAELQIADGDPVPSNTVEAKFKNDNKVIASISGLGEGDMNSNTGQIWYGGPDASLEITAVPVVYTSGGSVASLTINTFCGADAATDSEAPFVFPIGCKNYMTDITDMTHGGGDKPTFTVAGTPITADVDAVYLDFMAPAAPHFSVNPNDREDGWVNASVDFTGEQGSGSKKDGWLVYNKEGSDAGVGGYTPRLRYALAPSNKKVGTAIAADPVEAVVLPPGASGSTKEDALCVVVSAVDMLGNESTLPKADGDCKSAAEYASTTGTGEDAETTYAAGLLAGVDVDAPKLQFSPASPKDKATSLKEFQVQATDAGSGIRAAKSVVAEASRKDATESKKIDPLTVNVSLPLATTSGLNATDASVGYHTFTAHTVDKAGNASPKITRTALHDPMVPVVGLIVGSFDDKTSRYSLTATVTDNLSIKEYWAEMRFADITVGTGGTIANGLFLPREGAVPIDAYDAPLPLTTSKLVAPYVVQTYLYLQTDATTAGPLTGIGVVARDHGTNTNTAATANVTLTAPTTVADGLFDLEASAIAAPDQAASVDQPFPAAAYKVFQGFAATASESGGTVELTATASGTLFVKPTITTEYNDSGTPDDTSDDIAQVLADATEGLRDNPLTRVDFYAAVATAGGNGREALKYIGSVPGAAAGAEDYDSNDDGTDDSRRYTYVREMSKADFLAIVGGKGDYGVAEDGTADNTVDTADEGAIYAFGVQDSKGLALQSTPGDLYVKR